MRSIKLVTEVESVTFDFGVPDKLVFAALEWAQPGAGVVSMQVKPILEQILRAGSRVETQLAAVKAFGAVDSLHGKSIRITYVDGEGVTGLEPVGCVLTPDEESFLRNTALLADCYLLPELTLRPGATWEVEGAQFAGFVDPSLRAMPRGSVAIRRGQDEVVKGKTFAHLKVESGSLELDATNLQRSQVGVYYPEGDLSFDLKDGYVSSGTLGGRMILERVSKDHVLFEAKFRTEPRIKLTYHCETR